MPLTQPVVAVTEHTRAQLVGSGAPLFWKTQAGTAVVLPSLAVLGGGQTGAVFWQAGEQNCQPLRQNGQAGVLSAHLA